MSYQKTQVIGYLGRDPEMRYTPSGAPVTTFSVATTRKWTGKDGTPGEKTTWFRVTAWNKLAELCNQYLAKGRQVFVEGEIDVSAYLNKSGGAAASLELRAANVRFLSGGNGNGHDHGDEPEESGPAVGAEDIPF